MRVGGLWLSDGGKVGIAVKVRVASDVLVLRLEFGLSL